jgi:hypothetical protein
MRLAKAASKAANFQQAYAFYTRYLEADPDNYEAWLGKAFAARRISTLEAPIRA